MQPFKASRGRVKVALLAQERDLLARLLDDVAELLDADQPAPGSASTGPGVPAGEIDWAALEADLAAPPPSDPAVARLLPDASRDDPALAESFRRLTEPGLRDRKRSALSTAAAALRRDEPVLLAQREALSLLKGMTDVRLVLAERLGVRSDEDANVVHQMLRTAARPQAAQAMDEQWLALAALYDGLAYWQESLVRALR